MSNTSKGLLALALASAIWGGMYVASDALMHTMPPFVLLELREGISAAILLPLAFKTGGIRLIKRFELPSFVAAGVVGFAGSVGFQFFGTDLAGAALGSLVTASAPVLIAILGVVVLKESVPLRRWASIALALIGVVVIVGSPGAGKNVTRGVTLLLIAAFAWSIYTIISAKLLENHSALTVVSVACTIGALTSAPFAAFSFAHSPHPLPSNLPGWLEVAYVSLIGMALAFFLWIWGFKHVTASRGGVMLLFQPLVGVILGGVLLGEQITLGTIFGGTLLCIGVALAVISSKEVISTAST